MMEKVQMYCVPGLGASPKIFENLDLPEDRINIHFLEWKIPLSLEETIEHYAERMCRDIHHKNPILLGVSFGGVMVQEMAKVIDTKKIILVSSIKSRHELPNRLRVIRNTKAYKLFPTHVAENLEEYTKYFFGNFLKKKAELYRMYLPVRNPEYLKWSIYQVLHWKQDFHMDNLLHIHGTNDSVFPHKYIQSFTPVVDGKHEMILTKARYISKIITDNLISYKP